MEVILYYCIAKKTTAETHHLLVKIYVEHAPSITTYKDWFYRFTEMVITIPRTKIMEDQQKNLKIKN